MRILNRYLITDFMRSFLLTLAVFTFILCLGALFKAIDILSQDKGTLASIGLLLVYTIPYVLTFTIPMSTLTACLLLFGRMSMDGEISALRASGISIWQIITPILFSSVILSFVCLFINYELSPRCYQATKELLLDISMTAPIDLLKEGEFRAIGNHHMCVERKEGDRLYGVIVHETEDGRKTRDIQAAQAIIEARESLDGRGKDQLTIELFDCFVEENESAKEQRGKRNTAYYNERMVFSKDLDKFIRSPNARKRMKGRNGEDLLALIKAPNKEYPGKPEAELKKIKVKGRIEANKRISLSFTCFAFSMLAIPLGMRSKRKESYLGITLSIVMVFGYYFMTIVAKSLVDKPEMYPDLLIWLPLVVAQVAGFVMLQKIR